MNAREEWRVVCTAKHSTTGFHDKAAAAAWARGDNRTFPDHGPHTLESRTVTTVTTCSEWVGETQEALL